MNAITRTNHLMLAALGAALMVACSDGNTLLIGPKSKPPPPPINPTQEDFEWRGQIAQGLEIEIKNISGDIQASLAAGNEVEVFATKRGQRYDASDVRIDVVEHAGGVTICPVYPDRPGDRPNECLPGDEGFMNTNDNDVEVTFTVLVPEGVAFVAKNVAGGVDADGLESDAFVRTIAGDVRVETTGLAEASTISGSVTAYVGLADWDRDLSFRSVTGDVFVQIPAATNADVEVSTSNGTILSDFSLDETAFGKLEGTIGLGGPKLTLSTITGNITLQSGL